MTGRRYRVGSVQPGVTVPSIVCIQSIEHRIWWDVFVPLSGRPVVKGIDISDRQEEKLIDLACAAVACVAMGVSYDHLG